MPPVDGNVYKWVHDNNFAKLFRRSSPLLIYFFRWKISLDWWFIPTVFLLHIPSLIRWLSLSAINHKLINRIFLLIILLLFHLAVANQQAETSCCRAASPISSELPELSLFLFIYCFFLPSNDLLLFNFWGKKVNQKQRSRFSGIFYRQVTKLKWKEDILNDVDFPW